LTNLARGLGERPSFSLADAIIKEKRREADSRNVVLGRCSSEEGGVRKPFLARRLLLHFCARGMSWKGDGTRSDENIRTRFGEMLTIHSMKFVGLGERVLYYCIISSDGAGWLALFFTAAPETNTCVDGHADKFGGSWTKETPPTCNACTPTFPSNPPVDPIKTNEMSGVVISSRASQPLSGFKSRT
jgi:hypothetical protein